VSFENQSYSVDEGDRQVQLALVLSNSSETDINVTVLTTDGSAIGKY